jgi:hypothetical protein
MVTNTGLASSASVAVAVGHGEERLSKESKVKNWRLVTWS